MGKASRDKGKRGELQFAKFLTEHGFPAHRGRQYHGRDDAPDVVCPDLGSFHFEVKRVERFSLYDALEQATTDAAYSVPVVAHRRNGESWVIVMDAEDWIDLVKRGKEEATS